MSLISGLTKAVKSAAKAVSSSAKAATSKSGGNSNSSSSKNSSGNSPSTSTALTPERIATIQKMYSNVGYDANTDYAQAIKNAASRFGSEPYNVVQGEIDKLENQRYAKMLAQGTLNPSNMANYQPASVGNVNYGNYTPDYYEQIIKDNANVNGVFQPTTDIGQNVLPTDGLGGYTQSNPTGYGLYDYNSMFNSYNNQMQTMLNGFQKQQESALNDLKQTSNYNTNASNDVTSAARNIYKYDNPYKGGQGAQIKKNNAVSKYLANSAFKDNKFNQ